MRLTFRYLVALLASVNVWAQNIVGSSLRLNPTTLPTACNTGDIRIDTADSNKLKVCRGMVWTAVLDATATITTASTAGTAAFAAVSGTAAFSSVAGTASFSSTSGTAAFSSTSGTASFSTIAGSATTASSSGTASTSGTAAFSSVSGTASFSSVSGTASATTAFVTTPSGCSANQYAHHIAPTGNFTCSQVAFSELSGTASIAQGGTNNGTLAVTNGGLLWTDGSKVMNVGAGTANQVLVSNGAAAPTWGGGARVVTYSYKPAAGSCTWNRTATSVGAFSTNASCVSTSVSYTSGVCGVTTTDDDLPQIVLTGCPAGTYSIRATMDVSNGAGTPLLSVGITDGTTVTGLNAYVPSGTDTMLTSIEGLYNYSSTANHTFAIVGAASSSSITILNGNTNLTNLNFFIFYYPN